MSKVADKLSSGTSFARRAAVSKDEKYLTARRDKRSFVREIDGSGTPRFEISTRNPKADFDGVELAGGKIKYLAWIG